MMELRHIKEVPCIITRRGKVETATAAADVVAQARQRITDATAMLTSLEQSTAEAQAGLEAALLANQPTEPHRLELKNITELVADQRHEISQAKADIAQVHQLLDHHAASQIGLADADAIAALIQPFTNFLLEQQK